MQEETFTNENGKQIMVKVWQADDLVHFTIEGPDSIGEQIMTKTEASRLAGLLIKSLWQGK
jgi:hypothetical protein